MKIILLENVIGLGRAGDVKEVRSGYARNYLIPQRLAEVATKKKEAHLKRMAESLSKKAKAIFESAMQMKEEIEKESLEINAKAGEEGKLFGSVTHADIAQALTEKGYTVDKKKIVSDPVKTLGEHKISVRLDEGVVAEVLLTVSALEA